MTRAAARVAAVAAILAFACLAACTDYTVSLPPEEQDLTVSQIRAQLQTGSFRDKLAARKQIGKLPRDDRLRVLTALSRDRDLPTRTIAVQELGKMLPDDGAAEVLTRVAREDPEADIRGLAQEKLQPQKP